MLDSFSDGPRVVDSAEPVAHAHVCARYTLQSPLQLPIRFAERNGAFKLAGRIQNTNLT